MAKIVLFVSNKNMFLSKNTNIEGQIMFTITINGRVYRGTRKALKAFGKPRLTIFKKEVKK